jgi:hypothetical protein
MYFSCGSVSLETFSAIEWYPSLFLFMLFGYCLIVNHQMNTVFYLAACGLSWSLLLFLSICFKIIMTVWFQKHNMFTLICNVIAHSSIVFISCISLIRSFTLAFHHLHRASLSSPSLLFIEANWYRYISHLSVSPRLVLCWCSQSAFQFFIHLSQFFIVLCCWSICFCVHFTSFRFN